MIYDVTDHGRMQMSPVAVLTVLVNAIGVILGAVAGLLTYYWYARTRPEKPCGCSVGDFYGASQFQTKTEWQRYQHGARIRDERVTLERLSCGCCGETYWVQPAPPEDVVELYPDEDTIPRRDGRHSELRDKYTEGDRW